MASEENEHHKTIRQRMTEEELVKERIDEDGNKWRKVYFGGGEHFKNWLAQCKELGEVTVEEVDATGYKCFELAGEKLYRIWLKIDETNPDFQSEQFMIRFSLINQLRKYLRFRADLKTSNAEVTPALHSYKIKLG